jgi:hypothetical protein
MTTQEVAADVPANAHGPEADAHAMVTCMNARAQNSRAILATAASGYAQNQRGGAARTRSPAALARSVVSARRTARHLREHVPGTAVAAPMCMAAALVPIIFIVGLIVLFALGAWPYSIASAIVAVLLLVALALGLVRFLLRRDTMEPPHPTPRGTR